MAKKSKSNKIEATMQRHNGRIWSESAVGQGATFYFVLL
jgi:signal transduction histidine kinase